MSLVSCSVRSLEAELLINHAHALQRTFSLSNLTEKNVQVHLGCNFSDTFPAQVQLFLEEDGEKGSALGSSLFLRPFATRTIYLDLIPKLFADLSQLGELIERTNLSKANLNILFDCINDDDEKYSFSLPISVNFCLSIMHIDEMKIDFDQSIVGNTYVRDFQIWNRSEINLVYSLNVKNSKEKFLITFQDFDNSHIMPLGTPFVVPPFGSQRIRTSFKAKVIYIIFNYYILLFF
jgi:hypothetical protein